MNSLLPEPAIKYFLTNYQDDPAIIELASKMDTMFSQVKLEIQGLQERYVPESCPAALLEELGASIGVALLKSDTDSVKRAKITNGVEAQKYKSLWLQDAFGRIRAITGVDPLIYIDTTIVPWVLAGDETVPDTWNILGSDGIDLMTGFDLDGTGIDQSMLGCIRINIGTGQSANVPALVAELEHDVCPAYFVIFLGYLSGGSFVTYSGGQF